ncbi:IS1182 family transposase [Streptosporangium lutulentum]|uniref:Transposase n=1 Tax=Streptosporangium lutulentum TaxID=1461250 RepID=A0ABT9QPE7_9ACTN|nr:IS1182 family transposase [Streptosporangium lutulentum]MDP9847794.1 transposase [Streptosporangium lutulentum]
MSLRSTGSDQIPAATLAVARAAFPKGSLAIRIRDALGVLFQDRDFAAAFSARGRPALSPARLALVSILQFGEGLSDRQAAEAVRARIDWKYALGLELTDAGFDYSVLSEFRARLIAGSLEQSLLDTILDRAVTAGLLRAGGRQRTDSTHVLMAMRTMNRLEQVHETVRAALNALAAAAPDWLLAQAEPGWFERYEARVEDYRLPKSKAERIHFGHEIGADGNGVLCAVYSQAAPGWLRDIPAVQTLRHVWIQQYVTIDNQLRWLTSDEQPPGTIRQISPYDGDARSGTKRDSHWDGYKVHLTETCDTDAPHLITNVITAPSPGSDYEATDQVQEALASRGLTPAVHLADKGYMSAHNLARADRRGIELLGPMMPDNAWQNAEGNGFAVNDFAIDWDNRAMTCPTGATSLPWANETDQGGTPVIRVRFSMRDCKACLSRDLCTRGAKGRRITLRPQQEHEALQRARQRQSTDQWQQRYAHRAGVEGTIAQGVKGFGLRRSRYRGTAKTHLQHLLIAAAMNLTRLDAWLTGTPLAPTRTSHFAALLPAA